MTTQPNTLIDARPLYERLVTPGHVLSARLRVALPTIVRTTLLTFALSAAAAVYMLASSASGDLDSAATPAFESQRAAQVAEARAAWRMTPAELTAAELETIVKIGEAEDALKFIRDSLKGGVFKFDSEMMVRVSGADFAQGKWRPGKVAVAETGEIIAFGMYVRDQFNRTLRWAVIARKFDSEFKIAEMFALGALALERTLVSVDTHPDTFARIAAAPLKN
jgi:long-subunit fatty acid transport protein